MPTDTELELEEAKARIDCYRNVASAANSVRMLCDATRDVILLGMKLFEKQMDKAVAEAVRDIPKR